jgi:hypothetical protein
MVVIMGNKQTGGKCCFAEVFYIDAFNVDNIKANKRQLHGTNKRG